MSVYRVFLLLFVGAFSATALAGCGAADDSQRIRIWHQKIGAERVVFDDIIARYNAAHPDRRVEVLYKETEDLRNLYVIASIAGQGPELVFGPADNIGLFVTTRTVMPLDDVFPQNFFEQFTEQGLVQSEDTTWMVADQIGNHLTFVYNRALMPDPPETMSELISIGESLTTAGRGRVDQYGLTWNYTEPFFFIPFLTGFGGWVMDEEGNPTLDNEATVKAIQFILDLRDRYGIIPRESDYNVAETLFKEGRAASIINGPWAWAGYETAGVDYMIAPLPINEETGLPAAPMVSAKGYSINANVSEAKLPLVKEVLEYLTSYEVQEEMVERLATIPVNRVLLETSPALNENPILKASVRQAELGKPMPIVPQMRQIWDGMRGPYQLVMNGRVSAREGARLMQLEVEKRIADTFIGPPSRRQNQPAES